MRPFIELEDQLCQALTAAMGHLGTQRLFITGAELLALSQRPITVKFTDLADGLLVQLVDADIDLGLEQAATPTQEDARQMTRDQAIELARMAARLFRPTALVMPGDSNTVHAVGGVLQRDLNNPTDWVDRMLVEDWVIDAIRMAGAAKPAAQAFDLVKHLERQAEFSARTFGPGDRTKAVCDHIRKELIEVQDAAAAGKPTMPEWVDVIILGLDAAWRSGATPEQIVAAIVAKQTTNEGRSWPDWRTADPDRAIEHDRSGEQVAQ